MDLDGMDIDDSVEFVPRTKTFKHQSYNQSLKEVHLPSAFKQTHLENDIGDNDSHFHEALDHWRQLNLAPSFVQFASKADSLSASMPLLLHNWREIYELWEQALDRADDEGLRVLLDLLQKMVHDLRTTVSPVYPSLLDRLLGLLPRAISAAALTALLETLSSLFRYLLIPAIDKTLLPTTWDHICAVLPKCLGEIQRAVAEVWGATLRRMKIGPREEATRLIAQHTSTIEDASAWAIIYASKSVSQTLHTCAPSLFQTLVSYHISVAEDPEPTFKLIRRSLTALIHHVNTADNFSPVGEVIVTTLVSTLKDVDTSNDSGLSCLRRAFEVASIVASVRHGSRLTQSQKSTLFAELGTLPIIPSLQVPLLRYTLSLLMAGEMSLWLGPGLKFLQRIWNPADLQFSLKLHLCLADAGWHGWKLVAVPVLFKTILKPELGLLEETGQRTLIAFCAALMRTHKLGNLSDLDAVWKRKMEKVVSGRLAGGRWKDGGISSAVIELDNLLALLPLCSDPIAPYLVETVKSYIDQPIEGQDAKKIARIMASCMHAIAKRDVKEWSTSVELTLWTRRALQHWASHHELLSGLVALAQTCPTTQPLPLHEIYPRLYDSFLSHSRPIRLAALHLLDSKLVDPNHDQIEVLKRCLQGEEVPLDLQGVRERVLRIGRVGQVVGDEKGADLCARWLIAQLKVNLRPLWSPAAAALASLSHRFGDLVWRLLFTELQKMNEPTEGDEVHRHVYLDRDQVTGNEEDGPDGADGDPWEEERSWRDPSAHRIREIVIMWSHTVGEQATNSKEDKEEDRFDQQSYEHQLLSTLGECASLAEKHNRDLVPYFLQLNGHTEASVSTSLLPKPKLLAWLTLFSKFSNPKALYGTDTLRTLYMTLLSHPDRALQNTALNCLFTYKSPHLMPFEERLRALLDDTRWRDELSLLSLDTVPATSRSDFIDVFIRLLFGIMLEKKGRGRGGSGGTDRRAAVLSAFTGCTDMELGLLVDLMLRPFGWDRSSVGSLNLAIDSVFVSDTLDASISNKQLSGFLTLLGDVLKNMGSRLRCYWPALLGTTINLLNTVQGRIDVNDDTNAQAVEDGKDDEAEVEDVEVMDESEASPTTARKIARSIRQLGLKRFTDFFKLAVVFDFNPYMNAAFTSFINPRLPNLDKENTQAPSALLELFYTWTIDGMYIPLLVDFNNDTLPKIYDCLISTNVKPSVISRVFDIVDNLLSCAADDDYTRDAALKPHVSRLLTNLASLLERTKGTANIATPIGQRQINILSEIAQYSTNAEQASTLLGLFNPLLRRPAKIVPEKVKSGLVKIIGDLMHLVPDMQVTESTTYQKTYALLAQLFQSLRSRSARLSLVSAFHRLALIDGSLVSLTELVDSMNAYSTKRMDEPDFDRRLVALGELNETRYKILSCSEWLVILYNMLNFIQNPEELAIRNSASYAMRHFIDIVASQNSPEFEKTFTNVLYPGLRNGLRSKNEQVRVEVLSVIAYSVEKCENIPMLQDMRVLLEGGDDEANFFNNILHIQVHRRSRALRRLTQHCDAGHLKSTTIAEILMPLVGNYIVSTTAIDHHLVTDAILATGKMAKQLPWGAYYALIQKYLKLSRSKDESERVYVRTLVALLDNFHFSMEQEVVSEPGHDDNEDDEEVEPAEAEAAAEEVAKQTKNIARITDAVNLRLLPTLIGHLEKQDVTMDDNNRIPLSIGIVNVAMHLPQAAREAQITRLLTILSQILRSKSQETRDLVRDSLNRIAVHAGLAYLPIIMRELRAALLRGPQLHVLAYAVHSLVVHITNGEHAAKFTNLDNCVNDVAYVSAEVIFGESGKDVQSEDFKTKMREVKVSSSRALDTFSTMAKFITPSRISALLAPVKTIMHETESAKTMTLVDEVLKRIATGLNGNQHLVPPELLVLCHTLISQNAKFLQQSVAKKKNNIKGGAIVQMKRNEAKTADHYANNSFRFVAFGLDLLHTALKRNRFDFRDSSHITRLESMVVVIGNTLYSTNAIVLTLGIRCSAELAKCPLKAIEKSLPVVVRQILDIIKQTGNTESELVQVAFKSLATILRDGPPVQVKEKDLIYLIELLSPDLEDHTRQSSVFTLLRAIVARKFIVSEIYDLMQKVSEVSVTSQSPQVQELCRGVLLQFLLDYPQGKGRLRNQMAFFAKNLSYVHESGRTSIMELLGAIIIKFQVNLIHEYADLLFVALVMVVANDESSKCREMAAHLIKNLWKRLDEERRMVLLSHLHSWATQTAQPLLSWVSAQVCGFVIDVAQADSRSYVQPILEDLNTSLLHSSGALNAVEEGDDMQEQMDVELEWQLPYHCLTVLGKVLRVFPDFATKDSAVPWPLVVQHLLFPHAWVRTAACRLLGVLFAAVPVAAPRSELPDEHPLSPPGMRLVARKLTQQLKSEHLDQALGLQIVKNLFYLGKCFYCIPVSDCSSAEADAAKILDDEEPTANAADHQNKQQGEDSQQDLTNPLPWLFSKISYQIKSGHIARRSKATGKTNWSQQPLAGLRWFAAMTSHMDAERLEKFLVHILTPMYRITEDDTIRDSQMDELKTTAIELQDLVQSKVGTPKFAHVYNQIRQSVLGVRRERKVARVMQATTNPEAAARRKMQRNVIKKESRKRKERSFLEASGKFKRPREE